MNGFRYISYPQEVIFAAGALARVGEAGERFGWKRLLLCTNRSMKAAGRVAAVQAVLGDRLVALFDCVQPHVQDVQVDAGCALAARQSVDAVIGLGGGSPIGMAKAVAYALSATVPDDKASVPVVAIPTTYAGSEMTAVSGVTRTAEIPPRKVTLSDPRIAPRLVIYDPELTLDLSPEMTASTGMNALAHCIEALYSITRHPLSTAAAISGARSIQHALLRCYQHGNDRAARSEMLAGAHLAGLSLASVKMALHHGICHVLGGTAHVPHGIANGIMLPHVIRFNAEATASQLLPAAEALKISLNGISPRVAVEALAQKIFELAGKMNLPQRLRDVGVSASDIDQLAQLGFQNQTVQNNPKPITEPAQIEALLKAAW